jgi:hypothetical protein
MKITIINKGKSPIARVLAADPCPFVIDVPPDAKN